MDSLRWFSVSCDFILLANSRFQCFNVQCFTVFLYGSKLCGLDRYRITVTERLFRAHWIPQCGPGNKAADGTLYESHIPCPNRLPSTSLNIPRHRTQIPSENMQYIQKNCARICRMIYSSISSSFVTPPVNMCSQNRSEAISPCHGLICEC